MDGENNGKPYEQIDDLGVPLFLETPICPPLYPGRNERTATFASDQSSRLAMEAM